MKRWLSIIAALIGVMALSTGAWADSTVVVTPANLRGWAFLQETPTGSGQMTSGPATPPLGGGSARFTVDGTGGEALALGALQGTRLNALTKLQYSTYRAMGSAALAVALQFNIDVNGMDADMTFQGRLVFEPYHSQSVGSNTWQTWDTIPVSNAGSGNWWFTRAPGNAACPQTDPCTWTEVLTTFPNIAVHPTLGAVILKAGGGWAGGFDGNADALKIGVNRVTTTYDFEPAALDLKATPFEFVGTASQCGGTAGTDTVTATWVAGEGLADAGASNHALLLQKLGPTANCAAAGAEIDGVEGITLTEIGWDVRDCGHCGGGAPRFNVTTSDGMRHFIGCNSPAPTSISPLLDTQGRAWERRRYNPASAFPPIAAGSTVRSISIIFDEGSDIGSGSVFIDNIDINGVLIGKPGTNR